MSVIKSNERGFTLVELLVCIAVASVVIASLNSLVDGYLHLSQRGRDIMLANSYVEGKVEALRNEGFNSLTAGTYSLTSELPSDLPPSRSGSMTISAASGGIKQIDITVSYFDNGETSSYAYTTYIGELGVGQ
ncbi:MAG TPA: prepilin-type N-terminal cleavage/methylation domain-containing protein [Candidatus Saccharimonadales bacterium]|nr:prepilin-type N-terminal cleavage/methylation domain-containing protein [Candidatus Saccharimonadales bacterium]